MFDRLLTAPLWALFLGTGLPFGLFMGGMTLARGDLRLALIVAAAGAVFFGGLMAGSFHVRRRRLLRVLGPLPREDWGTVRKAAWKGAVPEDPRLRAATAELAEDQWTQHRRFRWLLYGAFGLNAIFQAVTAVVDRSWWHALAAVAFTFFLLSFPSQAKRLRRRHELLTTTPTPAGD